MASTESKSKNPSGVSTKSTPNNNVFIFVKCLRENLAELSTKTVVRCLDAQGSLYEKEVDSNDLEKLRNQASVFLGSFIEYLEKADFTSSEKDKLIVAMKLDGITNKVVCEKLDMKESALRVRYARLTKKVYRDIFNQDIPPKNLVYLSDLKVINRAISRLNARNVYYCLNKYIPFEFMNILKAEAQKAKDPAYVSEGTSDASYYSALHTVYLCSTEFLKSRLLDTTPDAIADVIEALESDGYSRVNATFASMMRDSDSVAFMTDEQFTSYVKGEISDFKAELKGL